MDVWTETSDAEEYDELSMRIAEGITTTADIAKAENDEARTEVAGATGEEPSTLEQIRRYDSINAVPIALLW